jgi:membrane protein
VCDAVESGYPFFAASIAYYTLMSIVPLLIFLFFTGMLLLNVNLRDLVPPEVLSSPLKPIFLRIEELVANSGFVSGTAIVAMLWFSKGIFVSLERSFCGILKVSSPSGLLHRHVLAVVVVFSLWLLMLVFYIAKFAVGLILKSFPVISFLSSLLVPLLLFSVLFSIYYFLLPLRLPPSFTLKVSVVVFLMLSAFEKLFVWFVLNVSKVSLLYGSFTAIVVFLLWIYYSAVVVLVGVGIVKGHILSEGRRACGPQGA